MCGVSKKGVNIMDYVYLSGIYQLSDVVFVFRKGFVIPPSLSDLATIRSLFPSLGAFIDVGGLVMRLVKFSYSFSLMLIMVFNHTANCIFFSHSQRVPATSIHRVVSFF